MLTSFMKELNKMKVALVSKSKPRRDILEDIGFSNLLIVESGFKENLDTTTMTNEQYVMGTCRGKFESFRARQLQQGFALCFFCDTIKVDPSGKICEKPINEKEHFEMMRAFAGKEHQVHTAFIISYNPKRLAEAMGLDASAFEGRNRPFLFARNE